MSLPQRVYELGRDLANSELVNTRVATNENMVAFQNLLNQSWPVDAAEQAQRDLVRGMYYGNPVGFLQYISIPRNRVRSLILWTESKRIAKFYNLNGCVHISWDDTTHTYSVVPHVPRQERNTQEPDAPANTPDLGVDGTPQADAQGEFQTVGRTARVPRQPRQPRVDPATGLPAPQQGHRRGPRQERRERRVQEQHGQKLTREDRLAMKQAKHQVRLARQAQQKAERLARQPAAGTYAAAAAGLNQTADAQADAQNVHVPTPIPSPQHTAAATNQSWADME